MRSRSTPCWWGGSAGCVRRDGGSASPVASPPSCRGGGARGKMAPPCRRRGSVRDHERASRGHPGRGGDRGGGHHRERVSLQQPVSGRNASFLLAELVAVGEPFARAARAEVGLQLPE